MADNYFSYFPIISYANTACRDITRRVRIDEETRNALTLYYTYTIKDGTRADIIADAYYENPQLDWLLWLTNDIIDPYYQWHLSTQDFDDLLVTKYGSIANSQKYIAFYRNNWYDDDSQISVDFYNNTLELDWKKYYAPFYGNGTKVLYYTRREEDWTMETNQIWKLEIANTANYEVGELVDVYTSATRSGGGEITSISNTFLLIKNIDGSFTANDTVTGEWANTSQTVTAVNLVYQAIANSEAVFWSPVTYYDLEMERNAWNRTILILDRENSRDTLRVINERLNE